jgi:hypothetical protein
MRSVRSSDATRNHPRRTAALALMATVVVTVLTGCRDDKQDYCDALASEKKSLSDLAAKAGEGQGDVLTPTLKSFERLRGDAPEQLADEWDTVVFAYRALADAVDAAGVDPADYQPGKRPPGVSAKDARRLAAVASELGSPRVRDAVAGIEDHAQQVCKVDFRS